MMSNKYKGILIFSILYTVLFVFDGDKLLASSLSNDHPFCSPFGNIETSFGFEWSRAK